MIWKDTIFSDTSPKNARAECREWRGDAGRTAETEKENEKIAAADVVGAAASVRVEAGDAKFGKWEYADFGRGAAAQP